MGRRNEPGLLEAAMKADWRFSAGLSAVALIAVLIVIPAIATGNPFLVALAPVARPFGLLFASVFGLIAAGKLILGKRTAQSFQSHTPERWTRPPAPVVTRPRKPNASELKRDVTSPARFEPRLTPRPTTWSLELLQSLDWKRFEEVVAAYFREKNFRSETIACGPDGGVDVRLFFRDQLAPVAIVQCKAWGKRLVGVGPVRELLGVMVHEKVSRGYFAATGKFSDDATSFAKANSIMLISGVDFLTAIAKMDSERGARLL